MRASEQSRERGMGGKFLQVRALLTEYPELTGFLTVIEGVKAAPAAVRNAAYIFQVDQTPLDGCNEISINATNNLKVIKFLEATYGSDELKNMEGAAVTWRIREYPDFADENGQPQRGLEIAIIEPYDENLPLMRFDDSTIATQSPAEPKPKAKTLAELKRERLNARTGPALEVVKVKPEESPMPDWAKPEKPTAPKGRRK